MNLFLRRRRRIDGNNCLRGQGQAEEESKRRREGDERDSNALHAEVRVSLGGVVRSYLSVGRETHATAGQETGATNPRTRLARNVG